VAHEGSYQSAFALFAAASFPAVVIIFFAKPSSTKII
jgi:hypothetical protein